MYAFAIVAGLMCFIIGVFGIIKSVITLCCVFFGCDDDNLDE